MNGNKHKDIFQNCICIFNQLNTVSSLVETVTRINQMNFFGERMTFVEAVNCFEK